MSPQTLPVIVPLRRHDLDWLRIIAFGLLIFYHVGMYYVTWDWHVKSRHAGPAFEPVMALINPWRLPLLFLISGVALRFAIDRARLRDFLPRRALRLVLPVVFGMLVWVMPQAYFQLLSKGEIGADFWGFYREYLDFDFEFSILTPTYNHLWYLVYILLYTLVVAALIPLLRPLDRPLEAGFAWLGRGRLGWRFLLLPTLPFLVYGVTLAPVFPVTMAVVDDWANHADLLTILLIGWFAAKSPAFWDGVRRHGRAGIVLALALGAMLLAERLNRTAVAADLDGFTLIAAIRIVFMWAVIVALLGLAQAWLNRPSRTLQFLSEAVFPYYVLHQTIIVAVGFWAGGLLLPVWLEAGIIVVATVGGCVVLTEAIKRVPLLRPLFGLSWAGSARRERGAVRMLPRLPALRPVRRGQF